MTSKTPVVVSDSEAAVDAVLARVGRDIVLALPLGVGKPLRFVNALYRRAQGDTSIRLHIITALSLQVPQGSSSLEDHFLTPFTQRLYADIPELEYARDALKENLPANVIVSEFFFQAGAMMQCKSQQRRFICTNYTHVLRDLMARGVNVLAQMVASDAEQSSQGFSLSSNPDLTLDLLPLLEERQARGEPVARMAELNRHLPYLGHDAVVPAQTFDVVLGHPESDYPLFSVPQMEISPQDHLIGFYASTLLRDGGTLQLGIGSLGSAVAHSAILRHCHNESWRQLYQLLSVEKRFPVVREWGGTAPFEHGLYGCSEMMTEDFIHLMNAGVLSRQVANGIVMHGGFYLGSNAFYQQLRELPDSQRQRICMTSVNFINDLYDHRFGDQRLKVSQRAHSRFINSAMMQTLSGETISDGLEYGRVVSGVGGQYNFVAMAHELPGARSIITLRSTRQSQGNTLSTLLFNYGHCTIPRHLRDIVITEYGIADLRGQEDEQVYRQLIRIADSRFQPQLLEQAKAAGKVAPDFQMPTDWQQNTPERVEAIVRGTDYGELFPAFPFGSDFTGEEKVLTTALKYLQAATVTRRGKLTTVIRALFSGRGREFESYLSRMSLAHPRGWMPRLERKLLIYALRKTGGNSQD